MYVRCRTVKESLSPLIQASNCVSSSSWRSMTARNRSISSFWALVVYRPTLCLFGSYVCPLAYLFWLTKK
jgi:hypothetical protein